MVVTQTAQEHKHTEPLWGKTGAKSKLVRGFTLVEILVVMSLIIVVVGIGFTVSIGSLQRRSFGADRDLFVELLQSARSRAIANSNESAHGLVIEEERFVRFEDTNENGLYDTNEPAEIIPRRSPGSIEGTSWFVFEQLSGNATRDGLTVLKGQRPVDVATISVFTNGRISWD